MIAPTTLALLLDGLGIDLSKPAKAELDTLRALRAAADADPAQASTDDAKAGQLTAANAATELDRLAESYARAQYRDEARRQLDSVLLGRWYAAMRADTTRLVTALQKVAAEPLAKVQEAGRHFPPDASPKQILAGGLESATAHHNLTAALDILAQVRNVRVELGGLDGSPGQDVSWWVRDLTDARSLSMAEYAYVRPGNSFHNLAAAGFTIAVNTTAEAAAVVAKVHGTTAALEAQQTAEHAATMRDVHGQAGWLAENQTAGVAK